MLIGALGVTASGGVAMPGLLFVLVAVSLVLNQQAKRHLRIARERADVTVIDPAPAAPAAVPSISPASPPAADDDADAHLLCLKCLLPFSGYWEASFLGLRKWPCPRCKYMSEWPLTHQREVGSWVLAGVSLLLTIAMVDAGMIPALGVVTIGVTVLLVLNHVAKRRLREAQERFRRAAAQGAEPPGEPPQPPP